ncbi:MAG: CHRD domain-containing protein [Gemmatimonas sp.]
MRSSRILLLASLVLGACNSYGSDNPYYPPVPVPSKGAALVQITVPSTATMTSHGETRSAIAVVTDSSGEIMNAPAITWTSSDTAVAIVTGTGAVGTIIAIDDGTASITATIGGVHQSVPITVHRVLASVVVINDLDVVGPGQTVQLSAFARDALGRAMPRVTQFTYSAPAPSKVVVSQAGVVTALIPTPAVRVAASASYEGFSASGFVDLAVYATPDFDFASQMLGEDERPTSVQSLGEGSSFFRLNGNRINYLITWVGLSGPATGVQIHGAGNSAQTADVLVDLPLPGQTSSWGILNTTFTAADIRPQGGQPAISLDSLQSLLSHQLAYINVRTGANPNGELRGQIVGPFR